MSAGTGDTIREVVGLIADREGFERAVQALTEAGFDHTDLSVLASHSSIDAAGKPGKAWQDALTAIAGEIRYEAPLVASGAIFLAGGPVAATVAGLIGAATAGVAATEVIREVTSTPDTEEFTRAIAAGSVIVWARADDAETEARARAALEAAGATNIHVHESTEESKQ